MISAVGLIGVASYLVVAAASMRAAKVQASWAQVPTRRSRAARDISPRLWISTAGFFIILAALRLFDVSETARKEFKHLARSSGIYAERRGMQADALWLLLGIVVLAVAILLYRYLPRLRASEFARLKMLVLAGIAGHVLLQLVRLISLHAVDRALYGPAHGNFVLDASFTAIVLLAAVRVIWLHRRDQRVQG